MDEATRKTMDILSTAVDGMLDHPGSGAQRAVAVLTTVFQNKNVPVDRLKKLKIDWCHMGEDIFPEIEVEFHKE